MAWTIGVGMVVGHVRRSFGLLDFVFVVKSLALLYRRGYQWVVGKRSDKKKGYGGRNKGLTFQYVGTFLNIG